LLVNSNIPADYFIGFLIYVLPFSLIFTVPWGFLTAVLLVFGRLSADNEFVAMRMAGVSTPRMVVSVLVFAVGLSALCLWMNLEVAPKASARLKRMTVEMAINNPDALFNDDQVIDKFPGYIIYVRDKKDKELNDLHMVQLGHLNRASKYIVARKALLIPRPESQAMEMEIQHAQVTTRDTVNHRDIDKINTGLSADSMTLGVPLDALYKKRSAQSDSMLTSAELTEELKRDDLNEKQRSGMLTELNKRYSYSLACVAFALLGIPLGITAQRRETSIGFALSLIVAFVYFFFIIVAEMLSDKPAAMPHLLMWSPNVLFLTLGAVLFYRLSRK